MNRFVLLFLSLLFCMTIHAQNEVCQPDPMYADSSAGIYPAPYHPELNPDGGIQTPACRNTYYEFTFTAIVPDSIQAPPPFPPVMISLDSFKIATTGAIIGLPSNFSYACNPPTCVIPKNETGCLKIFGVTDDTVGMYDIQVKVKIFSMLTPTGVDVTVPDDPEQGFFPGTYTITVLEEGSPECMVTNTKELYPGNLRATLSPNPAIATATLDIYTSQAGTYQFTLTDLTGKVLREQLPYLPQGNSQSTIDVSQLPQGMYLWTLRNAQTQVSGKLVVVR